MKKIKLFVDDVRDAPIGWVQTRKIDITILLLEAGIVETISLDYDLGLANHKTGYDIIKWIEKQVATKGFIPPVIEIHTQNPVGSKRMEAGIKKIKELAGQV